MSRLADEPTVDEAADSLERFGEVADTPRPPPFSRINAIPAASNAARSFSTDGNPRVSWLVRFAAPGEIGCAPIERGPGDRH